MEMLDTILRLKYVVAGLSSNCTDPKKKKVCSKNYLFQDGLEHDKPIQ